MSATGDAAEPRNPEFSSFLSGEKQRVDAALEAVALQGVKEIGPPLDEVVEYALSTTGKRLRPILCICAWRAATGRDDVPVSAYTLACALEIVHTYSLIHDDLPCMDDDDLRRGRPTVHRVFGTGRAVLAGAALLPLAVEVLDRAGAELGLDGGERSRLIIELTSAAGAEGMVGGQLLDLEAEGRTIDAAALEDIHARKTGALLTASLRIGAIAGHASDALLEALTRYGEAIGLAFQIADDLLDVEGSVAELGKVTQRDAALAKASYPSLYGVDGARALGRRKVDEAKSAIATLHSRDLEALAEYVIERRR